MESCERPQGGGKSVFRASHTRIPLFSEQPLEGKTEHLVSIWGQILFFCGVAIEWYRNFQPGIRLVRTQNKTSTPRKQAVHPGCTIARAVPVPWALTKIVTGMRGHIGLLFTHHFYPLTPLFVLLSPNDPPSCTNFVTISHQMIPFWHFVKISIYFNFVFSKMCPSLYFAWKIGKNVYNSHSLTPAFVGFLTEWSLFLRKKSLTERPRPT